MRDTVLVRECHAMVVYRVCFEGDDLTDDALAALAAAAGVTFEGSGCGPEEPSRHRALVEASVELRAIAAVRAVLQGHGSFAEFDASPVRDSRGELWQRPFYRSWQEIDWSVPERAHLNDVQRAVLGSMLDDAEPTWIIATRPDVAKDRASVEAVLEDLKEQGLVYAVLAEGGEPGRETETDRWWAATDETWDLLGFIKSPSYAWWLK